MEKRSGTEFLVMAAPTRIASSSSFLTIKQLLTPIPLAMLEISSHVGIVARTFVSEEDYGEQQDCTQGLVVVLFCAACIGSSWRIVKEGPAYEVQAQKRLVRLP